MNDEQLGVTGSPWLVRVGGKDRIVLAFFRREAAVLAEDAYMRATGVRASAEKVEPASRREINSFCDAIDAALEEPGMRTPTREEVELRERLRNLQTGVDARPGPNHIYYVRPRPALFDGAEMRGLGRASWSALHVLLLAAVPSIVFYGGHLVGAWSIFEPSTFVIFEVWAPSSAQVWITAKAVQFVWALGVWVGTRKHLEDAVQLNRQGPATLREQAYRE